MKTENRNKTWYEEQLEHTCVYKNLNKKKPTETNIKAKHKESVL